MLKLKVFLLATIFSFSTYTVTYATILSHSVEIGERFSYVQYLSIEANTLLDESEERNVPLQDVSDPIDSMPVELLSEAEQERYTVVNGDNLFRISLDHDVSLDSLASWNKLAGNLIHPGDVLIVGGNAGDSRTVLTESEKIPAVSTLTPSAPAVGDGKELLVTATAYTAYCKGCSGTTAYGIDLRTYPNQKVIAVDPKIIPLGVKVWVEGYGEAIAGDTGGAIKGKKIDVFIPTYDGAMAWGVKKVKVKILN
ncbi:3D domain-containing protein [Sporosarcina sp. JAI121]|uniref:3D domain-containing protein n=1 Tax=Sporosarcina sp. JAI121 TaxID=2723064 RepID=UPI00181B812D|nr:3D domain-containing protein [Sporosarcina sp. JAI121]NYF24814.1 3D (Asp-Asp-Asp) domain-containing protein [Sporosarcina sp. JAI121]